MPARIGLISDTHDHFDPRLPGLFRGVDRILHAGDVGRENILQQLEDIAPMTAVLGNNDLCLSLREFELLQMGRWKILLHHIVHPHAPSAALQRRMLLDQPDVVVGGHTHRAFTLVVSRTHFPSQPASLGGSPDQAFSIEDGQTLFVNPGYAGRPRFGYPRSVAILRCEERGVRTEFLAL
jgi:uncharacterized protein